MTLRGADAPRQSTTGMALGRLTSVECSMLAYCFRTSSRCTTSDDFRVNALKRSSWRSVVSLVVVLMLWFVACTTKTCNHSRRPPGSRDLSTLSSPLYPPLHQPRSQLELTLANSRLLIEHEHPLCIAVATHITTTTSFYIPHLLGQYLFAFAVANSLPDLPPCSPFSPPHVGAVRPTVGLFQTWAASCAPTRGFTGWLRLLSFLSLPTLLRT